LQIGVGLGQLIEPALGRVIRDRAVHPVPPGLDGVPAAVDANPVGLVPEGLDQVRGGARRQRHQCHNNGTGSREQGALQGTTQGKHVMASLLMI